MKPAARVVIDGFGDGGGEADDVVIENFFEFLLPCDEAGQIGEPFIAAGFDLREIFGGNNLFLHQRFAGEQFDLQPNLEFIFVGPNGPHFGARITRNHSLIKNENGEIKKPELCASPVGGTRFEPGRLQ